MRRNPIPAALRSLTLRLASSLLVEQLPEVRSATALPMREAQTLAMELLMQKALEHGLETTILDSPAYQRYSEQRRAAERGA